MSSIEIIILAIMLLLGVVSFGILFMPKKKEKNISVYKIPNYDPSVNKILYERCKNESDTITYAKQLANTDYVLEAMISYE